MDLFGPTRVPSIHGERYKCSVVDEATNYQWKFFVKNKGDVAGLLIILLNQLQSDVGTQVRVIVSDNGTEFKNNRMAQYCADKGIRQIFTVPHSSIQNGAVERSHRIDSDAAVCLLQDTGLPMSLWTYAMRFACYCRNRALSKASRVTKTPLELLTGTRPVYHSLGFGQEIYIQTKNRKLGKLDQKAVVGRFLGFPEHSKGIWVYVNGRVEVARTWIAKVQTEENGNSDKYTKKGAPYSRKRKEQRPVNTTTTASD